jgi:DNA-binding MarR family transcriptional regulator
VNLPMPRTYEELTRLDRMVHEPTRLALLTALSACAAADFTFLSRLLGVTNGNLGGHLSTLQKVGFVRLEKGYKGKVPQTLVSLTELGRHALDKHWERLEALRREGRSGTLIARLRAHAAG